MSLSKRLGFKIKLFGPQSIRIRLTRFFVLFFAVVILIFSGFVYHYFLTYTRDQFDTSIQNYATDLIRGIDISVFGRVTIERELLFDNPKVFPFTVGESLIQVTDPVGNVLARSRSLGQQVLPIEFRTLNRLNVEDPIFQNLSFGETSYRLLTIPFALEFGRRYVLQLAVPSRPIDQQQKNLLIFFLFAVPVAVGAMALGAFYLSGQALAPVSAMIDKTSHISAHQLHERLPVPETQDELNALSTSFNRVLDRLQRAFESQDRFVADASHQLRTPLTILRGEMDVFRSRPRSEKELEDFFKSASQELEHLSQVVSDLLLLARVDSGSEQLVFSETRVDEVLLEAVSRLERLAQKKNVKIQLNLETPNEQLSVPDDYVISADPDLIRTMFQSLIENAVKFSEPEKCVEILLSRAQAGIKIQVKNKGPVIPEEAQNRIFERFYRDQSLSRETPGSGLGLAIAQRIAEAHHGSIHVQSDSETGTLFTVFLNSSPT